MKVTLWGTRGSLASPGPDTIRYGGNTSCVSALGSEGTLLIFDAGTGIRVLGHHVPEETKCIDILLTHLHMDHVQGMPFFEPFFKPGVEIHIWGPTSTTQNLHARLLRYLSPPLFPVRVRDLLSTIHFHELSYDKFEIGEFVVLAQNIIHPNPTVGYRIMDRSKTFTYLPDHEPALGTRSFAGDKQWISGYELAEGADLLVHDAQYSAQEYSQRIGYGHSSIGQAIQFAGMASVKQLVPFHHDPSHSDSMLDQMINQVILDYTPKFKVTAGLEGTEIEVN